MSSFTDSMLEAGFDNPSDYLDFLCGEAEYKEMMKEDSESAKRFFELPRFRRKRYEPSCPNCGNSIFIDAERYNGSIRCDGFPACRYEKMLIDAEYYLAPSQSFRQMTKKWKQLREEMETFTECPNCRNKLKKIELGNFLYIKCYGFPVCNFSKKLPLKKNH